MHDAVRIEKHPPSLQVEFLYRIVTDGGAVRPEIVDPHEVQKGLVG